MDIATVSNTDLKVNDKKCVPENVMSATILCNVRNTKLLFAESLEQGFMEFVFDSSKIQLLPCFESTIIFCSRLKIHRKMS